MNRVSIIIPVYNYNKYLELSLDSAALQDYEDTEIVIVDDGSDSFCYDFLEDYKNTHKNVCVLHNQNHGVSYSRNFGIEHCTGDYILFHDSDDWLSTDALTKLVNALRGSDIVCGTLCEVWPHTNVILHQHAGVFTAENKNGFIDILFDMHETSCAKLYRKDFLMRNNIRFDEEIRNGEDGKFIHDVFAKCQSVSLIDEVIDYYNKIEKNTSVSKYYPDLIKWRKKECESRFRAYDAWSDKPDIYKDKRAKLYYDDIFSYYLDHDISEEKLFLLNDASFLDKYIIDENYSICGISQKETKKLLKENPQTLIEIYQKSNKKNLKRYVTELIKDICRFFKRRRYLRD